MKLKTITARSMADALAEVRRQLGSDAVVLHTRSVKRGGVFGLGARTCVEVTAGDGREIAHYRAQQRNKARRSREDNSNNAGRRRSNQAVSPPPAENAPRPSHALREHPAAGDLIRRTYQAARAEMATRPPAPQDARDTEPPLHAETRRHMATATATHAATAAATTGVAAAHSAYAATVPEAATTPSPIDAPTAPATHVHPLPHDSMRQLSEELREVKRLVGRAMRRGPGQTPGPVAPAAPPADAGSDALVDHYLALIRQEVAEELAEQVIHDVPAPTPEQGDALDDAERDARARRGVLEAVGRRIPVDADAGELKPTDDGRPRVIALVGPTGVGKTTTVAKLAATYKLKHRRNVAMITFDTYRIAAVDQLKTYAGIIGVPLHVAATPDEVTQALDKCAGCDAVLIDTAGRSPSDTRRLEETRGLLDAARPHETHLVVSAACSEAATLRVIERFDCLAGDRIIITKLDEAATYGVLLNVPRLSGKRLSFVTTGQEVPHHIEVGRADRLAALVLGDGALEEGGV